MGRIPKNCHQLIAICPMSTAAKQPTLFEVFGRTQSAVVPEINEGALNQVIDILTSSGEEMGKVVLLRSPRAGYGKTLLLQSMNSRLGETFHFLAVEPSGGGRIDGEVVLESTLRQLSEVLPASGGLTKFDLFARKLLALGLKPLLISGEIPSHDREGALFAIENRPIETFDFHHQQAATAHWTQANFEVLGPRLSSELSELSRCSLRGCAYWVDLLFRYATTPPEKVERTRLLNDAVFGDLRGQPGSGAEERLQSLLALLSLIEPVVLVFDETEGLSNQPDAGLKIAAFIVQLRQACPALTVVLSVNEDVWETGLNPLLPGGLADRLTEFEVKLGELSRSDAEKLLSSRFGSDAPAIAKQLNWPKPLSARAVLREGASAARALASKEVILTDEPSSMEKILGGATPPPLDTALNESKGESFEAKAERILEPSTSFEPDTAAGFQAPAASENTAPAPKPEPEPVVESEKPAPVKEVSPPVAEQDPFAEAKTVVPPASEVVAPETPAEPAPKSESEAAGSPFEIVPERPSKSPSQPDSEVAAEAPASPSSSPFTTTPVEPEVTKASAPVQVAAAATGEWSAQSAVDHFAASQATPAANPASAPTREEAKQAAPQEAAPIGSAFDATPPTEPVVVKTPTEPTPEPEPEPSPFQVLKEKQERAGLEAQAREKEAQQARDAQEAAAAAASAAVQSSPFAVSEPEAVASDPFSEVPTPATQPVTQATPSQVVPEAKAQETKAPDPQPSSPFAINESGSAIQSTMISESSAASGTTIPTESAPKQEAVPKPVVGQTPMTPEAPQKVEPTKSPFAAAPAAASPFAAAPNTEVASEEAEDVEALLNQFKKRFGQSGS